LGEIISVVCHGDYGVKISSESIRGKIMHAEFAGQEVQFCVSYSDDAEPMKGFAMVFFLTDRLQTQNIFERLSKDGIVTTPLDIQPWGDFYGKLTDKYGVQWMFNCDSSA
jgi:PhnB protein